MKKPDIYAMQAEARFSDYGAALGGGRLVKGPARVFPNVNTQHMGLVRGGLQTSITIRTLLPTPTEGGYMGTAPLGLQPKVYQADPWKGIK